MTGDRRRAIQECVLKILAIRYAAVPGLPVLWRHLLKGFITSSVPFLEDEIRSSVADLLERRLVAGQDTPGIGDMPEKGYTVTARGRDFLVRGFPWERLEDFSRGG